MIESFLLSLYTLIYSIVLLCLLPFEYLKRPKGLRNRWLMERLGYVSLENIKPRSKKIWIHAVSVGEVIASIPFIHEVKEKMPAVDLILTTVTDTGQNIARERLSGTAEIHYLPFDLPFSIKRFMKIMKPSLYISIETEIWPNLFRLLKIDGTPVLIMNGRISDDSFKGYRKIRFFMKRILSYVDLFCMQDELYGERIAALGAEKDKIRITGNFKFDIKIEGYKKKWVRYLKRPVILAGSTHETEEEMLLDAFKRLRASGDMTLIIAPRHPRRFDEVEEIIRKGGFNYLRISEIDGAVRDGGPIEAEVILIDVIGELASLYSICDLAIIGGSFSGRGGHNPLEPAFWGRPFICGEDMGNFPFVDEFYKRGAAIMTSRKALYEVLEKLLLSEDQRLIMGERAREIYKERSGAVSRSIEILERYIELP
jgi:3-deoxy-D-manno-octulosonic-acid transferase